MEGAFRMSRFFDLLFKVFIYVSRVFENDLELFDNPVKWIRLEKGVDEAHAHYCIGQHFSRKLASGQKSY